MKEKIFLNSNDDFHEMELIILQYVMIFKCHDETVTVVETWIISL